MKKILIISSFIFLLAVTSTIGYKVVSANTKIDEVEDIITYQEKKENYLTYYNYTIDNPNIVLNPYGNSPLTAMILFETENEEEITVTIKGKDSNSTYKNTFKKSKSHSIPIYGLYPNYNNEIIINCGKKTKTYIIKTEKLPADLVVSQKENKTNQLYFISDNNYTYAIDNNNEVRWYLTNKYIGKILPLKNNHLLLSNDTKIDNNYNSGLIEIDLLGKVYNEYDLGCKHYGSYAETNQSILVLSNDILEINKQNGTIINKIKLNDNYNTINYNEKTNIITVQNNKNNLEINYKTKKITTNRNLNNNIKSEKELLLPIYTTDEYLIKKGTKFTNNQKTPQSKENIFLLKYKKIDNNYKKHNIEIKKENDKLIVTGDFTKNKKAYIILDKFLGKKIYNLKNGYNYINKTGLSGNYSIYIKIDKKIYKTNNYVTF